MGKYLHAIHYCIKQVEVEGEKGKDGVTAIDIGYKC
jgi:hypothetical protein